MGEIAGKARAHKLVNFKQSEHLYILIFCCTVLVVDVYSDWCGPCSGMQGTLKKIKLEVGGDMLHIAMVRIFLKYN